MSVRILPGRAEVEGAEADFQESDEEEASEGGEESPNPPPGANAKEFTNQFAYKIFTSKFDEIVKASDLCPPEELDQLRGNLDRQRRPPGPPDPRCAAGPQRSRARRLRAGAQTLARALGLPQGGGISPSAPPPSCPPQR